MTLKQKIEDDTKRALKEHEGDLLSTLRMLLAAVRNREIEKRTKLSKRGGLPPQIFQEKNIRFFY